VSYRPLESEPVYDTAFNKTVEIFYKRFNNPLISKTMVAGIVTGLLSVWETTKKPFDGMYFSAVREAAHNSGKFTNNDFCNLTYERSKMKPFNYENEKDAFQKVKEWKKQGLTVGAKFGHFRRLTISHIFDLAITRALCDRLVLVAESGVRTAKYKTPKIELTDEQRVAMFTGSSLVDIVLITSGDDYSNNYYRKLTKRISPSVLFINSQWSEEMMAEYNLRARTCGAETFLLPSIGDLSTTDMEKFMFR